MIRTQIYLTQDEKADLQALAKSTGRKQADLIREAIDEYVVRTGAEQKERAFNRAAGMWKDCKDLPDFAAIRKSWDRD